MWLWTVNQSALFQHSVATLKFAAEADAIEKFQSRYCDYYNNVFWLVNTSHLTYNKQPE